MKLEQSQLNDVLAGVIDYRGKTPTKTASGIRLITAKVIKKGRVINDGPQEYIDPKTYDAVMRRGVPQKNDIFITTEAPLGELALWNSDEQIALAQRVILLRPDPTKIDTHFLFYHLQSTGFQAQLHANATGTTVPGIKNPVLRALTIRFPHIDQQREIGQILSAYDNLIETNRRRIALLEESARLLYREWFVNLRFPGHEAIETSGDLPKGWSRKPLADVIETNPKTPYEKDKPYPFVPMQSLSESGIVIGSREERVISGGAKFQNLDTLLARITPCLENGKTGFVQFLDEERPVASGSTEFIVMRSKTVNPYWVYCLARDESFREHAIRSMAGADGRQRVNPKCFETYMIYQAAEPILKEFEALVEPVFEQVETLARQNVALMAARDELLPKLMSGAIRV
jgi:type I restriction enzyme S subunit